MEIKNNAEIKETTKIRIGIKCKRQTPLFMVWREYYENGNIVYAKVLFEINAYQDDYYKLNKKPPNDCNRLSGKQKYTK